MQNTNTAYLNEPDEAPPPLWTIGLIAAELDAERHAVDYVIRTRFIEHVAMAGNARVFDRDGVARIRHELNAIAARRAQSEAAS